jgi:phage baseplate assembly protein gpV
MKWTPRIFLTSFFMLALSTHGVKAADIIWTNLNGGDWNTAANWSPNIAPGSSDNAYITNNGSYIVTILGTVTVANFTVGAAGGPLTLNVTGSLTLNGTGNVNSGSAMLLNGTLDGSGNLIVNSSMTWSGGGIMRGTGMLKISSGATLAINSAAGPGVTQRLIDNFGTITWSGSGDMYNYGGSTLQNEPGGLFDVKNDQKWGTQVGGSSGITVTNAGTIRKSAGTGTSAFGSVAFYNTGTIDIQTGVWDFPNYCQFYSGTAFTGAGTNRVDNNQATLNGSITSSNLELAVGLSLSGNATVSGTVRWTGGTLTGNGSMTLTTNSQFLISGSNDKSFSDYTINNSGTTVWSGTGNIQNTGSGIFNNQSNGLFLIENDQIFGVQIGGSAGITLNNSGVFIKTNSTGVTTFASVGINNNGIFDAESGTIAFSAGGTSSGNFNAAGGAVIDFLGGEQVLTNGASLAGFGVIEVKGGKLTVNAGVSPQNFSMAGGELAGSGNLTILNNMVWTGGQLDGGGALTITNGAALNIITTNATVFPPVSLAGRLLHNLGTVTWSGTLDIYDRGGGTFWNDVGGLLLVQNDQQFGFQIGGSAGITVTNAGTIRKTAGPGTSSFGNVALYNTGTIDVQSGTWDFANYSQFYSGTAFTGAGTNRLDNNQATLNGSITSQNLELATGLSLSGNATVNGTVRWTGGTLTGNGSMTLATNSQFLISSGNDKSFSDYTINNSGTAIWSGTGNILNTGSGKFNNQTNGVFEIQNDQILGVQIGGSPGITFTNAGVFTKIGGTNTTTLGSVAFQNGNTVDIQTGTFSVPGNFDPSPSGALRFTLGGTNAGQSGRLVIGGLAVLHGTLTIQLANGYFPNAGDTFELLHYGSKTGTFSAIYGLIQDCGLRFTPTITTTNILVTASYVTESSKPILSVQLVGSSIEIFWPCAFQSYTLQSSTNLSQTNWSNVAAPGISHIILPLSTTNQFFRLLKSI